MDTLTRKTDHKARFSLPADFASCLITIERRGNELRVRKAKSVPHPLTEAEIKAFNDYIPVPIEGKPLSETVIEEPPVNTAVAGGQRTSMTWPNSTFVGTASCNSRRKGEAAMTQSVEAVFDGAVLRPETALGLEPNTRVRLTVEVLPPTKPVPRSFLQTARSLDLRGPVDWSTNLDR